MDALNTLEAIREQVWQYELSNGGDADLHLKKISDILDEWRDD